MPEMSGAGINKGGEINLAELAADAYLLKPAASQVGTVASGISQTVTIDGTTEIIHWKNAAGTPEFALYGQVFDYTTLHTPGLNAVMQYNGTKWVSGPATSSLAWKDLTDPSATSFNAGSATAGGMGITFPSGLTNPEFMLLSPAAASPEYTVVNSPRIGQFGSFRGATASYPIGHYTQFLPTSVALHSGFLVTYFSVNGDYQGTFAASSIGYFSGQETAFGSANVMYGPYAGHLVTTDTYSYDNTLLGANAGYSLVNTGGTGTIPTDNTAVGMAALYSATRSSWSTAVGSMALQNYTSGSITTGGQTFTGNDAFGAVTLNGLTTGVGWVGLGWSAGESLSTGNRGVIIGQQAGRSLTTGSDLTVIGFFADALPATTTGALNIANFVFGTGLTTTGTTVATGKVSLGVLPANITGTWHVAASNTATGMVLSDGTLGAAGNSWFTWNSQTGTDNVTAFTFKPGTAPSYSQVAGSTYSLMGLSAYTWTGTATTTTVTALNGMQLNIAASTIAFSSANTVTTASTLYIAGAPAAGTNATITNPYALLIGGGAFGTYGPINSFIAQTTLSGTTAGTVVWSQPFQGGSMKRVLLYFNGYENDTSTAQTIVFSTAFSFSPMVTNSVTGLTVTATTTTLTIVAPNNTQLYSGWIIVEGY